MADPLSIAASIAGLIALAQEIYKQTSEYVQSVKNVDSKTTQFMSKVINLYGLLKDVSEVAESLDKEPAKSTESLRRTLNLCQTSLDPISTELGLKPDLTSNSLLALISRKLRWPFKDKEIEKHLVELERCKTSLSLCLTSRGLHTMSKIDATQQDILVALKQEIARASSQQTVSRAKLLLSIDDQDLLFRFSRLSSPAQAAFVARQRDELRQFVEQEELRVLQMLSTLDDAERLDLSRFQPLSQTCDWISHSEAYSDWVFGTARGLWLIRGPGMGKTTIAAFILGLLRDNLKIGEAVAGYACNFKARLLHPSLAILNAIAVQLAQQSEKSMQECLQFMDERIRQSATQPTIDDVQDLIIKMSFNFTRIFIVMDALDEFGGHQSELNSILELGVMSKRIKIFVTSRPISDPPTHLHGYQRLDFSTSNLHEGITAFVRAKLDEIGLLHSSLSDTDQERMISTIVQKSGGTFLWANLFIRGLPRVLDPSTALHAVDGPRWSQDMSLGTIYSRLLNNIRERYGAKNAISVVRLLNLLSQSDSGSKTMPQLRSKAQERGIIDIPDFEADEFIEMAKPLIDSAQNGELYFVHYSALEFISYSAAAQIQKWQDEQPGSLAD